MDPTDNNAPTRGLPEQSPGSGGPVRQPAGNAGHHSPTAASTPTPIPSGSSDSKTANTPFGPLNEPVSGNSSSSLPGGLQGRYRLIRVLGQGGFANVYLAHDSVLDQNVAIKVLKLGLAPQKERDRFLFEARVGAKLRHPNIVTVFDIIQTPDGLQMIMEYYPGGTLTERLRKGALRPREAIDVARQVALALGYAHRNDFIHRDVKPANIFLAGDGMVKLGDFGIAANTNLHEYTQTGMIIGTPLYMAPEQGLDSRNVDPRTDIYALGLTLYHMLTGRSPRVLDLDSIPPQFRTLLKCSTAHDRSQRLVSADQFIAMLDQIEQQWSASARTLSGQLAAASQTTITGEASAGAAASEVADLNSATPAPLTPASMISSTGGSRGGATGSSSQSGGAENGVTGAPMPLPAEATDSPAGIPTEGRIQPSGKFRLITLVVLLTALAGLVITVVRMRGRGEPTRLMTQSPRAIASPAPTTAMTPAPSPTVILTPAATPAPTASPTPTPTATPTATPSPTPLEPIPIGEAMNKLCEENRLVKVALGGLKFTGPLPLRANQVKEAVKILSEEVARHPDDPLLLALLGIAYHHAGEKLAARDTIQRALELNARAAQPIDFSDANANREAFGLNDLDAFGNRPVRPQLRPRDQRPLPRRAR